MFPAPAAVPAGEGPTCQQKWGTPGERGSSDIQWACGETAKRLADIDAFYLIVMVLHCPAAAIPRQ